MLTRSGAQIWGAKMFNSLEIMQKYFIKKILRLPIRTPDYLLYLETELWPMFVHTLEIHLRFKNRCLELDNERYPLFFAQEVIKNKVFWYEDWLQLEKEFGVPINELIKCNSNILEIINLVKDRFLNSYVTKLQNSISCLLYKELYGNENYTNKYINDRNLKTSDISWIFKVRGELMYLNKYKFKTTSKNCSLCNLQVEEDVWHFVARCPILSNIRSSHLKKKELNGDEFKSLFKPENLKSVALYCKDAWKYRYELVSEFNY